mmetsp:Transcript_37868/g.95723  ORF Transcript_37868/g.95723 Transcript_37868/m.95723 type:complete len:255 (-) Transcript_37868:835-1599(-)
MEQPSSGAERGPMARAPPTGENLPPVCRPWCTKGRTKHRKSLRTAHRRCFWRVWACGRPSSRPSRACGRTRLSSPRGSTTPLRWWKRRAPANGPSLKEEPRLKERLLDQAAPDPLPMRRPAGGVRRPGGAGGEGAQQLPAGDPQDGCKPHLDPAQGATRHPGTGKSRALTNMAMSMCRVFCESPVSSQSLAFDVPSRQDVNKWTTGLVVKWVDSWRTDQEGGAATAEAKAVAMQALQVRMHHVFFIHCLTSISC